MAWSLIKIDHCFQKLFWKNIMMIFRERFDFLDLFLFSKNQEKSVLLFSNCSQILISCSSLYNPVLKLFLFHIILFFLTLRSFSQNNLPNWFFSQFDCLFSTSSSSLVTPVLGKQENMFFKSWFIFRGRQIKVLPKRTNKAGISTSNRPPRGRGRGGFFRGGGRGYRGRGGFGAMRRPRGRGYYSPYWIPISLDIMQKYG